MRKQGFTLVELLVYIVIAALVVGVAGRAFLDATRQRVRTTQLLESTMGSGDVITYMEEDMRRVGAKAYMTPFSSTTSTSSSSVALLQTVPGVYMNVASTPLDSSSFIAGNGTTGVSDSIEFRSAVYNSVGVATGSEQIRWYVTPSKNLVRVVRARYNMTGAATSSSSTSDSVIMARNVQSFQVRYGLEREDSLVYTGLLQACPASASTPPSDTLALVSGFSSASVSLQTDGWQMGKLPKGTRAEFKVIGCASGAVQTFPVYGGRTYRVEFGLGSNPVAASNFRADLDYVAAAVRIASVTTALAGTSEFQFYSGLDNTIQGRSFEFTPSTPTTTTTQATIVFVTQMRGTGTLMDSAAFRVNYLRVKEIGRGGYDWRDVFPSDSIATKKYVKALEITLSAQTGTAVSNVRKLIAVPNNGAVAK